MANFRDKLAEIMAKMITTSKPNSTWYNSSKGAQIQPPHPKDVNAPQQHPYNEIEHGYIPTIGNQARNLYNRPPEGTSSSSQASGMAFGAQSYTGGKPSSVTPAEFRFKNPYVAQGAPYGVNVPHHNSDLISQAVKNGGHDGVIVRGSPIYKTEPITPKGGTPTSQTEDIYFPLKKGTVFSSMNGKKLYSIPGIGIGIGAGFTTPEE